MLWVVIPPVIILSVYLARKWYLARRLRIHGIGKGAPGFQTNVRRIRVTPEIAARLRRGEEVSPEEIAEASARAEAEEQTGSSSLSTSQATPSSKEPPLEPVNEWLPDTITNPKKRSKGKRK